MDGDEKVDGGKPDNGGRETVSRDERTVSDDDDDCNPFARSSLVARSPNKLVSVSTDGAISEKAITVGCPLNNKPGGDADDGEKIAANIEASSGANTEVMKNAPVNAFAALMNRGKSASVADISAAVEEDGLKRKPESPLEAKVPKRLKKSSLQLVSETIEKLKRQVDAQPTIKKEVKATMKELITVFAAHKQQCENATRLEADRHGQEQPLVDFRSGMSHGMSKGEIAGYVAKVWPVNAYQNTTFKRSKDGDQKLTSMIVFPKDMSTDVNFARLAAEVPILKTVSESKFKEEQSLKVLRSEQVEVPGISTGESSKVVLIKAALLSSGPELDIVDIMKWCELVCEEATAKSLKGAELVLPKGSDVASVRKAIECCLFGTHLMMTIRLSRGQRGGERIKGAPTTGVIIKPDEGRSYADVVSELKSNIKPTDIGIEVRSIRKTRNGEVHLQITESKAGGKASFMETAARIPTAKGVTQLIKRKGVVIEDVEEDVSAETLVDRLGEALNVNTDDIKLNEFRRAHWGTKSATAYLPVAAAESLIDMGRLTVGWTKCRIKEKVDPDFCHRCQRFGHPAKSCKETTSSGRLCLRCGSAEHLARTCTAPEHCYVCGENGHRANSLRCKVFKRLVEEKRARSRNGAH